MGETEAFKVVVIGAGPGGLVAAKELLEHDIRNIVVLEKGDRIGGLFSGSYDGLHLTSSACFSMFSDMPIGAGEESRFWKKAEVVDYWHRYASNFGVLPTIRFGTAVTSVDRLDDGRWVVATMDGPSLIADHVIIASGNNVHPVRPDWADAATDVPCIHSADYRSPADYEGRRVLVVGGGESASDITLEIAEVAEQVFISLRNGAGWVTPRLRGALAADISTHRAFWKLPYWTGGRVSGKIIAADRKRGEKDAILAAVAGLNMSVATPYGLRGTFGTKSLGLPTAIARHGAKVTGGVDRVEEGGATFITQQGERLTNIDAIVLATGFRSHVPFLQDGLSFRDPRTLFKNMIAPEIGGSLIWLGFARPTFGSQFPVMEMQARLAAQVVAGHLTLPDRNAMMAEAERDSRRWSVQFGHSGERVRGLIDYAHYMDDLARIVGCGPRLWRLLLTDPRLWLHVVYGPLQASQFRLHGPGAKPKLARDIILGLPVSPFNTVVKAGLTERLRDIVTLGPIRRRLRAGP